MATLTPCFICLRFAPAEPGDRRSVADIEGAGARFGLGPDMPWRVEVRFDTPDPGPTPSILRLFEVARASPLEKGRFLALLDVMDGDIDAALDAWGECGDYDRHLRAYFPLIAEGETAFPGAVDHDALHGILDRAGHVVPFGERELLLMRPRHAYLERHHARPDRPCLRRDNQDARGATIRMRERRRWRIEGRA